MPTSRRSRILTLGSDLAQTNNQSYKNAHGFSVVPLRHYAVMIACSEFRVMIDCAKL